jgi:hypothetical protein
MRLFEVRWHRWLIGWLATALWFGLLPVLVSTTYYAVKKTSDFDFTLKSRSLAYNSRTSDLIWAIRVGGASRYKSDAFFHATNFGINAEDRNSEQRANRVSNGELSGTYQATYIARVRGMLLPTIVCVFRDVARDGTSSFEIQDRGSGPIRTYTLYIALGSAAVLALLKITKRVAGRSWGASGKLQRSLE